MIFLLRFSWHICLSDVEVQKPTHNPKIQKTLRLHELFRKVRANFCLLSSDTSQEPNGNCSEKLVQMNFFILGWNFSAGFSSCYDLEKLSRIMTCFDSEGFEARRQATDLPLAVPYIGSTLPLGIVPPPLFLVLSRNLKNQLL